MQIVFCCTGNTCRSPMAEYIFKDVAAKAGLEGIETYSCGIMCSNGNPISDNSLKALAEIGIDGSSHKSRSITLRELIESDYVITMTEAHAQYLRQYMNAGDNVISLGRITGDGRDVADPYGGSLDSYRLTRDQISEMIAILVNMLAEKEKKKGETDKNIEENTDSRADQSAE